MKNKKKKLLLFIVLVILVLFVSKLLLKDSIIIFINTEKIELGDSESINLNTFNSENDVIVKKSFSTEEITINGKKINNYEELNLGKIEINNESKIVIEVTNNLGLKKEYVINILPSTFPEYKIDGESLYEGDYYMSTYSFDYITNHYIFKLDEKGNMKYYKKVPYVSFDFRKVKNKNGDIRYMYLEATADNFEGVASILPCDLVILDENYEEIDRVKYKTKDGKNISLENHTYIYLDDDHYILTAYINRTKTINEQVINSSDCLIQEIKDGEILWEFDSANYSELYEYSTYEKLDYLIPYQDYIHINSMSIDIEDGNLLCSFRNIDSVFKISRTTGELMWILGGKGDQFNITENQMFSKQHSIVSIGNNTVLLYDNGNARNRSRVLKIKLDEINKKIIDYKEYDTELYAYMMGSVQLLDESKETYLICYGGGDYSKYSVEEINYLTKEVAFKFTFVNSSSLYNVNKIK